MERIVTITLHKDSAGEYALTVHPLTLTVAPTYEDEDENQQPVSVKWLLRENPDNPDFPNARQLTVTFGELPSPFTITANNQPLPQNESFTEPVGSTGAEMVTPPVQDLVFMADDAIKLFKYSIAVDTNDNQRIEIDPHVRWRRRGLTRDSILQD
jgi:hypothetical protein